MAEAREEIEVDVAIVGGGPAGLSAAIRFRQLCLEHGLDLRVCVLEKGAAIGSHILSGAVLEPRALQELLPEWKSLGAPLHTEVTSDHFMFLDESSTYELPTPPQMKNHGNYIVRLGAFCRWLAEQAEHLGVEIFPGFAGTEVLWNEDQRVIGVATGDMGIGKDGKPKPNFQRGVAIKAKQTLFAEGCRGSLSESLIERLQLRAGHEPQTYGLGIKELWKVRPEHHMPGRVIHTIGWPLDRDTYGGSFLYHLEDSLVSIGLVVGLDFDNPYLSPFEEFQRLKTHSAFRPLFEGAERIGYGARAINEGGFQSIPKLTFPGGMLIGCSAGFVNVPKIKGTHTAMKSGMLAAEATFAALRDETSGSEVTSYEVSLRKSWVAEELFRVRNIRPAFKKGLWTGLLYSAIDTYLFRGQAPWTFSHQPDHLNMRFKEKVKKINYPKPDGVLTFDRTSSLFLSNLNHDHDQPIHLKLRFPQQAIRTNYRLYDSPEQRYCPANVYEIVYDEKQKPSLQINAQNCVHCKSCDIKDPNITWVPPEGGAGPHYEDL